MTLFTFANPTDLILEIPTISQNQAFSQPHSRYQAYINQLCLGAVLPWLQEELAPQVQVWPSTTALASFWELVNGTALILDATRLILVPSEDIDLSELRVPQEWVDIPSWAGDYYLAVQVEPDEGYVRVWGYCTHAQLKTQGSYDPSDRTYSLDASDMINDINVLTVSLQLCPDAATRSTIEQLPPLLQPQAENLITRLGNPEIITPRLEIPWALWFGLVAHGGWRQSLYQRRLGLPEQWSVMQWLQSGVSLVAETVGWGRLNLQQTAAGARSVSEVQIQHPLFRQIEIAGQLYEMLITPQAEPEAGVWRFELRHVTVGAAIPGGFKLRLLTEDLQPFPNNEAIATTAVEALFIEVALEPGEGIVWEIEPLPENYDREILKF
ncbi:Protein of unknown function (DUF1822) [Cylindrospermum stagnale PCC 7417]|uniref:DUF1822 family protein n=1 Tax=Cylindrospermum stagnale PCC 7417 TaxID=56107 RepID=K9WUT2_9NOST|nr:DUF1822 family protein [Cylindrospermum stagnale]AFZ24125.1 Protein of unknown function (DUF1822) [Cylindrospermum stagnale PCC 7417]